MIKLENFEVVGWEHAIRGMRNPMNSWEKTDSFECVSPVPAFAVCDDCPMHQGEEPHDFCVRDRIGASHIIGPNDHSLMMKLRNAGTDHRKFMRQIVVYVDITAPLYWWKEFDTYKVGTVANSCSTMHKIHAKEFTLDDFSYEDLIETVVVKDNLPLCGQFATNPLNVLIGVIDSLNVCRQVFIETKDKIYWKQMIQLLPTSYNQKRTVMLNYEVLANIYKSRKNHKLDEWRVLCDWAEGLPYSELITGPTLNDIPICKEIMNEAEKRVAESVSVEKKRGHWLSSYNPVTCLTTLKCSECGAIHMNPGELITLTGCPDCGAIMD